MSSQGMGLGKEVFQGIVFGFIAIAICVVIGSQIASAMSHGPKAPAEAAPAAAPAAE